MNNKVFISKDNPSVIRINELCINCGECLRTCKEVTGIKDNLICLNCGQCILNCPVGALREKYDYKRILNYLNDTSWTVIVTVSPAVRVSLGEAFKDEKGEFVEGKMVAALKKLGFDYILDTSFFADVTIVEEANEFLARRKEKRKGPMLTSCCPSFVKYMQHYHDNLLENISTTKSPISIGGSLIRSYYSSLLELDSNKIITVALTPCVSKKAEIKDYELQGMDYVITTRELAFMIKENEIAFNDLKEEEFDSLWTTSSVGGLMFGTSGGVSASLIKYLNLKNVKTKEKEGIVQKEGTLGKEKITIGIVNGLNNLEKILTEKEKYDFIEVMACPNGCVGGGGQILSNKKERAEVLNERSKSLKENAESKKIKDITDNQEIDELYTSYLQCPNSQIAENLLHVSKKNVKI